MGEYLQPALICNFRFLAVTCDDYRCSFNKIYTQLFFLQNIPHLPEENSCLNYLGHLHDVDIIYESVLAIPCQQWMECKSITPSVNETGQ